MAMNPLRWSPRDRARRAVAPYRTDRQQPRQRGHAGLPGTDIDFRQAMARAAKTVPGVHLSTTQSGTAARPGRRSGESRSQVPLTARVKS